jgi:AcrR family transcriptional regulator
MVVSRAALSKGEATRERILEMAARLAAREGLRGLSLSQLADSLGVSKSGLFAHFRSKEELQVETLRAFAVKFVEQVLKPAFARPRGLPRLRAAFERWLRWTVDPSFPGGCLFVAAATELDDCEGRARDFLVQSERELLGMIAQSARLAVEEGHFRADLDCDQFAFEQHAILLGFNHSRRLLREAKAERRARDAFEALVRASQPKS